MKKYIRSDEIRYTNSNGKQRVIPVDNYDIRYLIKEIEDVMGYEFASQVEQLLIDKDHDTNLMNEDITDNIEGHVNAFTENREDAMTATYKLLDMVNEWNAVAKGEDKAKLDQMYDIIVDDLEPALSEIDGDIYDLKEDFGIK